MVSYKFLLVDDGREKFCTVCIDGEEAFLIFMDSVS